MNSQDFSFTKRPIDRATLVSKRQSVISAILPHSGTSNNASARTSPTNNYKLSSRTFSNDGKKNLVDADFRSDDPLLDYNEQIRAPKVRTHKSVGDIGSILQEIDKSTGNKKNNARNEILMFMEASTNNPTANKTETTTQKLYQPAEVDISRSTSFDTDLTPSTSVGDDAYTIENYLKTSISSNQLITNLDPMAGHKIGIVTSDISSNSKKNSNDSIVSSKKQPRFTMIPIRSIDEPKTPNYVPCVLRCSDFSSVQPKDFYNYSTSTSSDFTDSDITSNLDENNLSRDHWKPNNSTSKCFDCSKVFTILNRRHHCRKCGEIFCANCLIAKAKLSLKNCDFEMNGILSKVCFHCGKEWSDFLVENFKKYNDIEGLTNPNFKQKLGLKYDLTHAQEQKSSVPADWTWSSF